MATKKKAARRTTAKAPAKKAKKPSTKKIGGLVDPPDDSALSKYRAKTEKRLDALMSDAQQVGENLFGAIELARNRYTDEWEKMQRRHLSIQMAVWKVRPTRKDVVQLKAGIDEELEALEASWEATSEQVREAISALTPEED